jgi:CRP/FNR family transcriptional regulator, anaerobic regulatory protein
LCRFSRSELTNFIQSSPNTKRLLIEFATRELDMAQDQLQLLGNGSAEEKVAIFLVNWRNFRYFQKLCRCRCGVRISLIFSV